VLESHAVEPEFVQPKAYLTLAFCAPPYVSDERKLVTYLPTWLPADVTYCEVCVRLRVCAHANAVEDQFCGRVIFAWTNFFFIIILLITFHFSELNSY